MQFHNLIRQSIVFFFLPPPLHQHIHQEVWESFKPRKPRITKTGRQPPLHWERLGRDSFPWPGWYWPPALIEKAGFSWCPCPRPAVPKCGPGRTQHPFWKFPGPNLPPNNAKPSLSPGSNAQRLWHSRWHGHSRANERIRGLQGFKICSNS